jgi:hypothetical protein
MLIRKKNIILDAFLAGVLFLMALIILMMSSCKHEADVIPKQITDNASVNGNGNGNNNQQSTCDPDSVYFETQVLPLLVSNCAKSGCHSVADHKEGIVLNNYSNVMATGEIEPGRPDHSKIYEAMIKSDPDDKMPPAPASMTNSQINLIYKWIEQGAQNNTCMNTCDTNNVKFAGVISPILQNSCNGCHSGSSPAGLIDLTSFPSVLALAQNGKLLGSVNHSAGFQPMPKGGNMLPDCQIDQIRIWIQNGSMNN